jgi:hypothetical protein
MLARLNERVFLFPEIPLMTRDFLFGDKNSESA